MIETQSIKGWQIILLIVLFTFLASAIILLIARPPRGTPILLEPTATLSPITVYVSGEIVQPGVYQVPRGSRVNDLLLLAGGLTKNADGSSINLAAQLRDGQQIHIPPVTQIPIGERNIPISTNQVIPSPGTPIDLNQATFDQLEALPGIGPTKANAIITYRDTKGPFLSIEDLLFVDGIGESTFEQIKDLVFVILP